MTDADIDTETRQALTPTGRLFLRELEWSDGPLSVAEFCDRTGARTTAAWEAVGDLRAQGLIDGRPAPKQAAGREFVLGDGSEAESVSGFRS